MEQKENKTKNPVVNPVIKTLQVDHESADANLLVRICASLISPCAALWLQIRQCIDTCNEKYFLAYSFKSKSGTARVKVFSIESTEEYINTEDPTDVKEKPDQDRWIKLFKSTAPGHFNPTSTCISAFDVSGSSFGICALALDNGICVCADRSSNAVKMVRYVVVVVVVVPPRIACAIQERVNCWPCSLRSAARWPD